MKCWECGGKATKTRNIMAQRRMSDGFIVSMAVPNEGQRCYCDKCFDKHMAEMREEEQLYIRLKKKRMYESAVDKLEHQKLSFVEYEEAIKAVGEFVKEHPDKFDSSYEMVAAIILIHNHVRCTMQYKIGKYQVDFLLKEEKIVLEIDGERHKDKKNFDSQRDSYIRKQLGPGWHVVRIPTEFLDQRASNLWRAIEKVVDYRETGKIDYQKIFE